MTPRPTLARSILLTVALPVLVLAGCAAPGPVTTVPSPPESPSISPTPPASPTAVAFVQPDRCATVLPESRVADFQARGLELLGGPDGKYGDSYLADSTPEQQAGGITCIWGNDATGISAWTVSVAPMSSATRQAVLTGLESQGLLRGTDAASGAVTYAELGDDTLGPAIYNILRPDSWISVISAAGGETAYTDDVSIANEVEALVYR